MGRAETLRGLGRELRLAGAYEPEADVCLYHGDCLELLEQVPSRAAQLVVTSPPYNIGKSYEKRQPLDEYIEGQRVVIARCSELLCDGGSICWQVGNYVDDGEVSPLDALLYPLFKAQGLKLRNRIIWHFGHGLHCSRRFSGRAPEVPREATPQGREVRPVVGQPAREEPDGRLGDPQRQGEPRREDDPPVSVPD